LPPDDGNCCEGVLATTDSQRTVATLD